MADCGSFVSAVGTSIEFAGVVWFAAGAWFTARRANRTRAEAKRVTAEYLERMGNDPTAGEWYRDELARLGLTSPPYSDALLPPEEASEVAAREHVAGWRGPAAVVAIGLLVDLIGSWMQAAAS
ncbi:hypothetical protein Cme02nite_45190 [Catellatospora methionotrophica]|uniref:Uncharacterized protein n=1 Tax=Catellatospora methionotrophica TaxID=121620 RepID=A0A8J3PGD5_9ACTN|nr:hypothetical protein [Catellatospora methionotrophica]GIG16187.1 hypothetical protein Cme02nite_45190 [Catellatospora methionotrophica]